MPDCNINEGSLYLKVFFCMRKNNIVIIQKIFILKYLIYLRKQNKNYVDIKNLLNKGISTRNPYNKVILFLQLDFLGNLSKRPLALRIFFYNK
jgi:hypothetical protein